MSFNEKIRGKLEEIDPMVFYGRAGKLDETVLWNLSLIHISEPTRH